ncbi:MAG: DEAD/DEAH box helicase, partial [Deltaproteobacteria bacterium]|nr:DEAD/DEAH box helicase [Deltaproteobacteria bacterium]
CESRATAERVAEQMAARGTAVFVHHSAVAREERQRAEAKFHEHDPGGACIVCTSTLELGIDVGDLDRVVQVDAPSTVGSFLQRMGRTGRREGQTPNTTFLTTEAMGALQAVALVELAKRGWVELIEKPSRAWPVLIHQVVAMSLEKDGVAPDEAWAVLSRVEDFKGIGRGEFDRLIDGLVRDEALVRVSGRLVVGPKVEKHFGRKNFREIYAVFESPQSYTVTAGQQIIGTLEQNFVDLLVQGESAFLLAGRAWWVERVSHDERRVAVVAAPRGKEPSWGGILPRFLGFEVCQAMLAVTLSDGPIPWLSPAAMEKIQEWRDSLDGVDVRGGLVGSGDGVRWWTFAGGRINQTLKLVVSALRSTWSVSADNLGVRIRSDGGVVHGDVRTLVEQLADPETWESESLWAEVAARLPNYRLSKFQVLMPPWVVREMLAGYLVDVEGGCRAAQRLVTGMSEAAHIERTTRSALQRLIERPTPAEPDPGTEHVPEAGAMVRDRSRELVWVADSAGLSRAVEALTNEERIGLDVETTLRGQTLCLVQIAGRRTTWLIDALMIDDLTPLSRVLSEPKIQKLVHNASFERSVLGRHGLVLEGVMDTLALSRSRRGKANGGHSLRAVCARELGQALDKQAQVSDWSRRPLRPWQRDYAALDAEVLEEIYQRLMSSSVLK